MLPPRGCLASLLLFASSCGRLGYGTLEPLPDAGSEGGLAFEAPELIEELDPVLGDSIDDPTLSPDGLELIFNREQPANDVYHALRPSVGAPFTGVELVAELSSNNVDSTPKLTADGLGITIGSQRGGLATLDLFAATRAGIDSAWTTPVAIDELNTAGANELSGVISADGLEMLFTRSDPGDVSVVFLARRDTPSDPWQTPVALDFGVNSATDAIWIGPDELVLAAESVRGDLDLVHARRVSDTEFEIVEDVAGVNADDANETDPWLSAAGDELFFTSGRSGNSRIYRAIRTSR